MADDSSIGSAGGASEAAPDGREGPASKSGYEAYLHSLAVFGMRPGLERVVALLAALGEPQRSFRAIHIVGTNGKSSTTRYAAAVLRAAGLRDAAYLSPHITGFPERVLISGRPVSTDAFGAAVERVRAESRRLPAALGPVTQFEVLTVAAFVAMHEAGVEAAAVEAGLGGRLDATNVLAAPVVVLTNVGLEHTEVLGDTREQIFAEKAAVIARGADAVFGPLDGLEVAAEEVCARAGARAHLLGRDLTVTGVPSDFAVTVGGSDRYDGLAVPSEAGYQVLNAALAVAACRLLLGALDAGVVRRALRATAVPGRLQIAAHEPLVVADGAHNPDGAAALSGALRTMAPPRPRVGVLAVMRDKAVDEMMSLLLPLFDTVVCTQASEPRSLTADELAERIGDAVDVRREADPHRAVALARELAGPAGSVVITGSLYLLTDLKDLLD